MLIYPGMKRVKGHMEFLIPGGDCPMGPSVSDGDWEMIAPRKDKSNLGYSPLSCALALTLKALTVPIIQRNRALRTVLILTRYESTRNF
jgi:hypothetical protein